MILLLTEYIEYIIIVFLLLALISYLSNIFYEFVFSFINPLSANPTKCSNTNCLSVFDHFVGLALEGLSNFKPMFQCSFNGVVVCKQSCFMWGIIK